MSKQTTKKRNGNGSQVKGGSAEQRGAEDANKMNKRERKTTQGYTEPKVTEGRRTRVH
jgi:hypothetical protein